MKSTHIVVACARVPVLGLALALLFGLTPQVQAETQVRFLIIPKADFATSNTDPARFLPDGEIRLYRPGEYKPRLIVKPNEPTVLSEGSWLWIAEAPGWVTVEAGALAVPTASSKSEKRTVVGLLVPACEVTLSDAKHWPGTERVDFVSLTHGVTFPLPIDFRSTVRIPAGRWLAYSVGPRGLIGITKPRSCSAAQELHLKTIPTPGRDREEWMVHVEAPEGVEAKWEDYQVAARAPLRSGPPPVLAAASLWNGRRGTFFFLDVPAGSNRLLTVQHPALRSAQQEVSVVGARALELGPLVLKPRRHLTVVVDYRPARPHHDQRLVLVECGPRPLSLADDFHPACNERGRLEQPLRLGVSEYRFEQLDDSQYRLDAEIDDDVVWGLGENLIPRLDPENDEPVPPLASTVEELHVFGHLLEAGEPVAGEVRIFREESDFARSFPTDDRLTYHLYYFGYLTDERWFVEEVSARIPARSRAMPLLSYLSACTADGRCRVFNSLSAIVGQGRWDIELGEGGTIEFVSLDAATGEPVPNAMVGLARTPSIFFVEGKVFEHLHAKNFMPDLMSTGPTGRTQVRWPRSEKTSYGASKAGYAIARGEFQPLPGVTVTVEIQLQPEDSQSDGVRVRLRHGKALPKAFFLVVDDHGVRQSCSRTGASDGFVSFPPNCLAGRKVIVIHPAAALQILDGDSLRSAAEISVEPAPAKPATVRVVDGDGRPIPDVAFELRFPEVTLTLNDFYFASSLSGQPLGLGRTSGDGRVLLPTVDPRAWGPVEAVIVLGQEEHAVEVELGTEGVLEVR
jgi:hypothetical protein